MRYLIVLSLFLASPAWAANAPQADSGTVVGVTATTSMQLPNDEVQVAYRIEASGVDAARLRKQVNIVADKVQKALDGFPELHRQTTGRSLQIMNHYDKATGRQVRDGWRMVQSEQLTGRDMQAVPAWIEAIEQAGGHLDRLSFTVSEAASSTALETLNDQAVRQFRAKAAAMAGSLDAGSFRILNLRSDAMSPPQPVMQRGVMAMQSAEAAPALNSGESRLSVTVSGEILLPERTYPVK